MESKKIILDNKENISRESEEDNYSNDIYNSSKEQNYDSQIKEMYSQIDTESEDIKYFMKVAKCTLEDAIYEKIAATLQDDYYISYEEAMEYIQNYRTKVIRGGY